MHHHVLGVVEDGAGAKEHLKVEDIVVCGGRLPKGVLRSKTSGGQPEAGPPLYVSLKPPWTRSGARWPAPRRDGNPPRLHGLGNLPEQFDL
jgi:hypothetical protein